MEDTFPLVTSEQKRDVYGFVVRPQHLQRYREYANIYKEEEQERSYRWKNFLERLAIAREVPSDDSSNKEANKEDAAKDEDAGPAKHAAAAVEETTSENKQNEESEILIWSQIRPLLGVIEEMISHPLRGLRKGSFGGEVTTTLKTVVEEKNSGAYLEDGDSEDEFYEVERPDSANETSSIESLRSRHGENVVTEVPCFHWKEELECLVQGGVPMALRGQLWQAFIGVRARWMEGYYHALIAPETSNFESKEIDDSSSNSNDNTQRKPQECTLEKWTIQIEKDLSRTFPGHHALDEDGRNALRRLLTAYARHNPSVGYCQGMNFFAGLLLLMMPEENAFWGLMGIMDDYFDGYYSEDMIESQVDQLVFEEIAREKFSKLVNHLDYLGVEVTLVTGSWFLSIFVNMLPWESVLRVWDVLLFDGNRAMLFRTAFALMELYGPTLITTRDAGDAVTLLQFLAGSTFDSSQLVLTACMGYQAVDETRLQEIRDKHRPSVLTSMKERCKEFIWGDSKGLASKLYSFKHDPGAALTESLDNEGLNYVCPNGEAKLLESGEEELAEFDIPTLDGEMDSLPGLKKQVTWLKVELCKQLEEKRSAILRAEELEAALMEMVKQDNRRLLSAKVEQLEIEMAELRQTLSDKQEQEHAMLEVLMRVEQEQKVTEDARIFAEKNAATQQYAVYVLQEKYEEAMNLLSQMEERAVMAETVLETTLQHQSSKVKAQPSCTSPRDPPLEHGASWNLGLLSRQFGLGWLDKDKGRPSHVEDLNDKKTVE